MNRRRTSVVVSIITFAIAVAIMLAILVPGQVKAQGGLGIDTTINKSPLPFTPTEKTIQTLNTDPDFSTFAERITAAVSGNKIMLGTITNVVEACLTKMLTADKVGVAACADFVENQNSAFSTFLKENQNLSGIILYGG